VTHLLHTSQLIINPGNTRIAYKPRHTHTHTHPETLEAREKTQVAISQEGLCFMELDIF
jgi:hypothetical protein